MRNGTPQSTEEPDHTDEEAAEVRRGPQRWREGFKDEYQKTEHVDGRRMPALEHLSMNWWQDGSMEGQHREAKWHGRGTKIGVERKTQATAGKL